MADHYGCICIVDSRVEFGLFCACAIGKTLVFYANVKSGAVGLTVASDVINGTNALLNQTKVPEMKFFSIKHLFPAHSSTYACHVAANTHHSPYN